MHKFCALFLGFLLVAAVGFSACGSSDEGQRARYKQAKQMEEKIRALNWCDLVRMEGGNLGLVIREVTGSGDLIGIATWDWGTETKYSVEALSYRRITIIRQEDPGYENALKEFRIRKRSLK